MSEKSYLCNICNKKFDSDEYKYSKNKNKCILHSKDRIDNPDSNKYFWNQIEDCITTINDKGRELSEDDDGREELAEAIRKEYNFEMYKYEFNDIEFPQFKFVDNDNNYIFNYLLDKYDLNFNNCTFLGYIDFSLIYNAKNINFNNCTFKKNVEFKYSIYNNSFIFENCRISGNLIFQNTTFNNLTSFINTEVEGKTNYIHTKFQSLALFSDFKSKELIFDNTFFKDESNFLDIKIDKLSRETARIIKNSFEQQNNIIEANRFYALEMKEREKELNWKKDFFEKLVFKFHGISSNHSQDWILTLFWILNITFGFFITEKSFELFGNTFISYIPILVLMILGITNSSLSSIIRTTFIVILTFLNYGIFRIISDDNSLDCVANKINPFSIMTKGEDLDFPTMIYKIIIAYLIYQLIISIRQNTRRK